jgi:hypothetical protein
MLFAFLFLGGSLAANGVQESRMAKAKELIAEKNYNDAILILTAVVREEPDRQDEAQELISQIVRLRNQYNNDYENLIKLLYDQKDEATALKVISQLEALDKNPNKQTLDDINQAKRTARLVANNKRYQDIMARALAFLNRQQYGAAVQVYLEGSDLAKDMFIEAGYGNVLGNLVDRAWADLTAASTLFVQAEAKLKALPAQGTALLAAGTSPSPALDAALASMRDLAAWRQRVWADGRSLQAQNDLLTRNSRQADFFLSYSVRLIHGPVDSKQPEGILGAVDRLWSQVLDPWSAQIRTGVEARYTEAKAALDQGQYAQAATAFEALRVRARQGLDALTLWNRISGIDEKGALDPEVKARLEPVLPLGVWLEHRLALAGEGLRAVSDLPRGADLAARTDLDRPGLESARADLHTQKLAFAGFADAAGQWGPQSLALEADGYNTVDGVPFANAWQATWAGYRQQAQQQEALIVDRRGTLDYGLLDGRFQTLQSTLASARDQVEGTVKFPLQASSRLETLGPQQAALAKDVGDFITQYDGEAADVKTAAVLRWPVRGRDLLDRLTSAQTLQSQLLVTARANYQQSQTLKKDAQAQLPQIDAAVAAENFTQARTVLNRIAVAYAQSLTLQDDSVFRGDSDAQVKALSEQILKAENEVVVRDVRKLITQGSQAYLGQQFTQAEQILGRARARWATTNTDPNTEVEYWATLASYALSVTTGRELSPIDPLYNEVQQLLNFARRDFTMAQDQITAGQKDAGLDLMKQAKDILAKVLLPFPLNQEARLLNLQILKASDPDNFPALFKQNFDAAVGRINTDATGAYNDLQDLDKIQPGYPGMDAAIKQVRQKLNLDHVAVDPKQLAQARTLVAQATRLVNSGIAAQLPAAQVQVRQALALDPTNGDAQALSDRISLLLKPTVVTLTPTQIGELNAILDLYRAQRTLDALSQLTEFKAKYPGVGSVQAVIEAERRIRAVN